MERYGRRRGALALTAVTVLLMFVAASAVGATYLFGSSMLTNQPPQTQIADMVDGEVLPAGTIKVSGAAADDGKVQAVSVRIDGGSPVSVVPVIDDYSSWSIPLDLSPGNHVIEIEAVDDLGKVNMTEISVSVTDSAMIMPADRVAEAAGPSGTFVDYPIPSVQEGIRISGGPDCSPASGNMFPVGTMIVTCSVSFAGGNVATDSFKVSVLDTTPPTIKAPQDKNVENSGVAFMKISLGTPIAKDEVDASPKVTNNAPANGFALGTTTVVWTVEDDHGNKATATQKVTVTAAADYGVIVEDEKSATTYVGGGGGGSGGSSSSSSQDQDEEEDAGNDDSGGESEPPEYTLTVNAVDSAGDAISVSTTIRATDGTVLQTGNTPMSFSGSDLTYEIVMADYEDAVFDRWENGASSLTRELTLDADTTITAHYDASAEADDTTAPIVTASVAGGTFVSAQSVTLSASEPATIYYTKDGTNPTASSNVYGSPISITSTTTLKYFAIDSAGNGGGIVTQVYTIDIVLPTVTANPAGGTYATGQSIILSASEPATIYYTTNGNNPTTSSSAYSSPISVASTITLKYFAKDAAGNSGSISTQTYTINAADTTDPSIEITNPGEDSEIADDDGEIVVTGTASDSESGIEVVEVRVDDGDYIEATPAAEGDWSTWSVTLEVAPGERRLVPRATDNAGNQAWNSIYVTIASPPPDDGGGGSSNPLDDFGIEKIYPTADDGNEWYVNMEDPDSDSMFRNLPAMTQQSDGSWQVNGGSRGQVRMEAWSPSNEKWLNVEITMYAKMVSGSNELLQMYSRGGHHTSSNECLGSAYKARFYGDGEARWVKEVTHPSYTSNRGSVEATNTPLADRWIGLKAVIYNIVDDGNTYVRMESYIDDDVTDSDGNLVIGNNWELASVVEDRGGWGTSNSDFETTCEPLDADGTEQYRQRDEILSLPGGTATQNLAAWRSDDLTWNWKYLTVREIDPS